MTISREARLHEDWARQRPTRMIAETYEAFRLGREGKQTPLHASDSFEACRDLAAAGTLHKQQFAIRVTDLTSGAVTLHIYQMKQGQRQYRGVIEGWVSPPKAVEVAVIRTVEPTYPDDVARVVGLPLGSSRPIANEPFPVREGAEL